MYVLYERSAVSKIWVMWPWLMKKATKILFGFSLLPILEAKTVIIIVNLVQERMSCSKLLCYISVVSGCWKRWDNLVGASCNVFIPSWSFLPTISTKVALVDASSCGWWPRKLLLHIETETDAWLLPPIPSKQHFCLIFGKFFPSQLGEGGYFFMKPQIKKKNLWFHSIKFSSWLLDPVHSLNFQAKMHEQNWILGAKCSHRHDLGTLDPA